VRYGVRPGGNFEGATILSLSAPMEEVERVVGPDAQRLLASAREKLLAARSERPAPARDDKVLTGWNGLTIAALADAGAAFDRPDYTDAARETAAFLLERLLVDGRLRRVWMEGEARHLACLDDYADLAHGLLVLYEATFEPRWLEAARKLAADMVRLFRDPQGGGFFYSGSDAEALVARTRDLEDHPTPAGNSQAAWVLLRLAHLATNPELETIALDALRLVRDDVARYPQAFGTALVALDFHTAGPREVAIVGRLDDPATAELVEAARANAGPDAVMAVGDPGDPRFAAAAPLLARRPTLDGRPAAYVCERFVCAAPVSEPDALAAQLRR
jgi:uncharacterized protein YyaL (SSP411 family)